jgi:hypothetical protein
MVQVHFSFLFLGFFDWEVRLTPEESKRLTKRVWLVDELLPKRLEFIDFSGEILTDGLVSKAGSG